MNARLQDMIVRMEVERLFARTFVIAGGAFWSMAAFAGLYVYARTGLATALVGAVSPLAVSLAALVVGWHYERSAAAMLTLGAATTVAYGVIASWEPSAWVIAGSFLVAPMLVAAALFILARREQVLLDAAFLSASSDLKPNAVRS